MLSKAKNLSELNIRRSSTSVVFSSPTIILNVAKNITEPTTRLNPFPTKKNTPRKKTT